MISDATYAFERPLWESGIRRIAGIDEAGRGPLAGPVVAAAVVLTRESALRGVRDSKALNPDERERLFNEIMDCAEGVGVGIIDHAVIDEINILNATFRAMHRAIDNLPGRPDHLLVDGNRFAEAGIPWTAIVRGDALSVSIAAASIIAKVTRDRIMTAYDSDFPGYGFAKHKGYPTREHRAAIGRLGFSPIHRRSFSVKETPAMIAE